MKIKIQVPISGTKEAIWNVISDIENTPSYISGVEKVEILEKPETDLVGLKWVETRTLFGKTATETMWITGAEKPYYYTTRAESHGAIYTTRVFIDEVDGTAHLGMEFHAKAQSIGAKIMSVIFGFMLKNATKKALMQDLHDIKELVEKSGK